MRPLTKQDIRECSHQDDNWVFCVEDPFIYKNKVKNAVEWLKNEIKRSMCKENIDFGEEEWGCNQGLRKSLKLIDVAFAPIMKKDEKHG